jgi:hypothetical protein
MRRTTADLPTLSVPGTGTSPYLPGSRGERAGQVRAGHVPAPSGY